MYYNWPLRAAFSFGMCGFGTLSGSFEVSIKVTGLFFFSEKYHVFRKLCVKHHHSYYSKTQLPKT